MPIVKCPNCGAALHTDDLIPVQRLSPAAQHVLSRAPRRFLDGQPIPIREIAQSVGYSPTQAHRILLELVGAGYIERIPRGKTKHIYRAMPERAVSTV